MRRKEFKEWAIIKGDLQVNSIAAYCKYLNHIEKLFRFDLDDKFKDNVDKNRIYAFKALEDEIKTDNSEKTKYPPSQIGSALKKYDLFCKENNP